MQKGGLGVAAITATSGVATASTVTLKGKIINYNGKPVSHRKVAVNEQREGGNSGYMATDSNGEFSTTVNSNQSYRLALYKSGNGQLLAPILNDVPHIKGLGDHDVGTEDTDIGTLEIPRGYEVDVLVLDSNGEPVQGADVSFRDESGYGSPDHLVTTDEDGYLVIENADFTGFEAVGFTNISASFSEDGSNDSEYKYNSRFHISEPSTIKVQADEGMSKVSGANSDKSPIGTATSTSEAPSSKTTTQGSTSRETGNASPSSPSTTTSPKRGFLRNGDDVQEIEIITDPLFMTVGGFTLSVVGILYQLTRG